METTVDMKMDPLKAALEATRTNAREAALTQKQERKVAESADVIWGIDSNLNMNIPVDGWSTLHWRRYFAQHFRDVFGHVYTGNAKIDGGHMKQALFRAQNQLGMSASEFKEFLDCVGRVNMPIYKGQNRLYMIFSLKDDVGDFYNKEIHVRKYTDDNSELKMRDLILNREDFRISIRDNCKVENGEVIDFDERLLIQLGIPIMIQYLTIQHKMPEDRINKLIISKIRKIITEDVSKSGAKKASPRFERVIKNTILWEPYPWRANDWRKSDLRKIVDHFQYATKKWWREEPPLGIKSATCLKVLRSVKRSKA